MRPKKNTPGEAAVASARPATSPEAQEQYMINLTMQLVARRDGFQCRNNALPEAGYYESGP